MVLSGRFELDILLSYRFLESHKLLFNDMVS